MGISKNNGTPKSSILIGFSIIFTIHFGGKLPLFLETTIYLKKLLSKKKIRTEFVAEISGAYENLLETSGFTYHLLMPKWTEEQTAAIYAVDQFESFSNPYTKEATFGVEKNQTR